MTKTATHGSLPNPVSALHPQIYRSFGRIILFSADPGKGTVAEAGNTHSPSKTLFRRTQAKSDGRSCLSIRWCGEGPMPAPTGTLYAASTQVKEMFRTRQVEKVKDR
jgi:hypothetical protein